MTYKLFLDDIRDAPDNTWVVARNTEEAQLYIKENGFPYLISFDHDLGINENCEELPTGYDFAKWVVEEDMPHGVLPENFEFWVHSANPVGARNIESYLLNYLKSKKN